MKNFLLFPALLFGLLLVMPTESQAQWQPDVRLTNDPDFSYTSSNNAWCIAASGSVVHVVWRDNRDGSRQIYYKRSTDAGVSWGADTRLTNNSGGFDPSVAVSGSVVHVVWSDGEIYFKRSTDAGASWETDIRLTNSNPYWSMNPSVAVSGTVVHVVWQDTRDGNWEIYYKRSTDAGVSWGADTRLTNNIWTSESSSVTVSGPVVHVVWHDNRDGNNEIYYKRSTDAGVSWGTDTRLTNNTFSMSPSVSVSGSVVHFVWRDIRDGNWEIYYKRSTDAGVSWGTDTRLTNNTANSDGPSVTVSGSGVYVVWVDYRAGNSEIYYNRSIDAGVSWETDTRLTSNTAFSQFPSVAVSGQVVHVVWSDFRDGNDEIYYKQDPTGNPVVGVQMIGSEIPKEFKLGQNYPNPFNPSTTFVFSLPERSLATLKVFDILGNEVALLISEELPAGTYVRQWDAVGLASGVYFYRLQADGLVETKKMTILK